jgi:tellurite resistance protein
MTPAPTPLKYLGAPWFASVMGLCGLALAWQRAVPLMGEMAGAAALVLGLLAALLCLLLLGLYGLRRSRHPQATLEDFRHPVRHPFVATLPVSVLLLATVAVASTGPSALARGLWLLGAVWQFAVTLWLLGRWLNGNKAGGLVWAGVTPALFIPVVGNALVPLAGVPLGYEAWSAAQFGLGLLFWPVLLLLLFVRIGIAGMWPERLMPATFITVAPPAVIGSVALQWGAPALMGWMAWGVALFFLLWSAQVFRRALVQPFSMAFWALAFPLAAFCALTLRLGDGGPAWFSALAMLLLALSTLVVAALALATVKGLRSGSLLVAEVVPLATSAPA